ncbi:MAG: Rpn family recombination-promoting nuclease/putative transposase, partial [Clostridiales bacterium]|nr:Rpn family recombination-promoting nuclease/putative transposase [Clostridiales bacterium]
NDFVFLKTFGEKGDEEQLLSLLNAILKKTGRDTLTSIEIIESRTITGEVIGDKTSILDVVANTSDGTRIHIEVQLRDYGNMNNRSLFYWSREYAGELSRGEDYDQLRKVIVINIVNFAVVAVDDFHTTFHLWEDTYKDFLLTDALEMHFIDIKKFNKLLEKDLRNNPLHRWLTFLDQNTGENTLKEVTAMDAAIQKADERMNFLANDKEALRLYHLREMARIDYNSGMKKAKAEGKAEEKAEIAKSMLKDGMAPEMAAKYTGLPLELVRQLNQQ